MREGSRKRIMKRGAARERGEIVSCSEEGKRNQREKSVRKGRKERDSQSVEERAEIGEKISREKRRCREEKGPERWRMC